MECMGYHQEDVCGWGPWGPCYDGSHNDRPGLYILFHLKAVQPFQYKIDTSLTTIDRGGKALSPESQSIEIYLNFVPRLNSQKNMTRIKIFFFQFYPCPSSTAIDQVL